MAQLSLNNKESATTNISPFFANFGKHPNLFGDPRTHRSAQSAIEKAKTLKMIYENISIMQRKSEEYQNNKRKMSP